MATSAFEFPRRRRWGLIKVLASASAALSLLAACTSSESTEQPTGSTVAAAPTTAHAASTTQAPAATVPATSAPVTQAPASTVPATSAPAETAPSVSSAPPRVQALAAVDEAISLATADGLQAVSDRWGASDANNWLYVLDEDGTIVFHPQSTLIGQSIVGELGTAASGYPFSERVLNAPSDGHWATYLAVSPHLGRLDAPETATSESAPPIDLGKAFYDDTLVMHYLWAKPHDGHVYVSSFSSPATEFIEVILRLSATEVLKGNLSVATEAAADPQTIVAASVAMAKWLRDEGSGNYKFLGFASNADGTILGSNLDPSSVGSNVNDSVGFDLTAESTPAGVWVTDADRDLRVFLVSVGDIVIGGGAYLP